MSEAVGLGATAMRSLLFAPGDRPDLIASALRSGAEAVIVDLEDAVRPERRAEARAGLRSTLDAAGRALFLNGSRMCHEAPSREGASRK